VCDDEEKHDDAASYGIDLVPEDLHDGTYRVVYTRTRM
jgi:hypothetical protein